jgi:Gpi18-like mannosyltransferase
MGEGYRISTSKNAEYASLIGLILAAITVRLLLFQTQGLKVDLDIYISWLRAAADNGPLLFYNTTNSDYPPFNFYILWLFGYAAKNLSLFGTNLITYVVKLIPSIFDIATTCLIFVYVRAHSSLKVSLTVAAAYAFNPAVVFNSAIWGQFDSIYVFFLLLSFVLILSAKPTLSVSTFTIAVLTKPQAIILAPLFAFLLYKKHGFRRMLASSAIVVATTLLVILPFQWDNPITFLTKIYFNGYSHYPFSSVNAFNLWGFFGLWMPDTQGILFINPFVIGWILFVVATFLSLNLVNERLNPSGDTLVFFSAFVLLFSFFTLSTRIHERYNFPSLSFLALMIPFSKRMRVIYGVLTVTLFINLAYVMVTFNSNIIIQNGDPVAVCVSLVNALVFIYVMVMMWREMKGSEQILRS